MLSCIAALSQPLVWDSFPLCQYPLRTSLACTDTFDIFIRVMHVRAVILVFMAAKHFARYQGTHSSRRHVQRERQRWLARAAWFTAAKSHEADGTPLWPPIVSSCAWSNGNVSIAAVCRPSGSDQQSAEPAFVQTA